MRRALPVVRGVSEFLVGLMPPDIADTLSKTALTNPEGAVVPPAPGETGYSNGQTQGLENLVDGQTPNHLANPRQVRQRQ